MIPQLNSEPPKDQGSASSRCCAATDARFTPPLDLPAPKGKEAEWALLRLAEMCGVERKHETWQDLADKILDSMRDVSCDVCDKD